MILEMSEKRKKNDLSGRVKVRSNKNFDEMYCV